MVKKIKKLERENDFFPMSWKSFLNLSIWWLKEGCKYRWLAIFSCVHLIQLKSRWPLVPEILECSWMFLDFICFWLVLDKVCFSTLGSWMFLNFFNPMNIFLLHENMLYVSGRTWYITTFTFNCLFSHKL